MYDSPIEINKIIKDLTKASISQPQAKAIAKTIKNVTNEYQSNRVINIKFDRVVSQIDSRINRVKSKILKLVVGIVFLQMLMNFAINHWGL